MTSVLNYLKTFQIHSLIPVYLYYASNQYKLDCLDLCIHTKWYAGIVSCIITLQSHHQFSLLCSPSKQIDILDLLIMDDQVECVRKCLETSVFDIHTIESIILFYSSIPMYKMAIEYIVTSQSTPKIVYKKHYSIVQDNIERVAYILRCLVTTKKEKVYYSIIQSRCIDLGNYLFKQI